MSFSIFKKSIFISLLITQGYAWGFPWLTIYDIANYATLISLMSRPVLLDIADQRMMEKSLASRTDVLPAPEHIKQATHSLLTKLGIRNPQQYEVKIVPDNVMTSCVLGKTIYLEDHVTHNQYLRDFIIGHETAHIAYRHQYQMSVIKMLHPVTLFIVIKLFNKIISEHFKNCNQSNLFLLYRIISENSFLHYLFIKSLGIDTKINNWLSRYFEKAADLASARTNGTTRGGIRYFDIILRNLGENKNDKQHPLLSERIAYLQQWEAQHNQSQSVKS